MWQTLLSCIPDIRDTLNELEQYAPDQIQTNVEPADDDSRIDDTIIKWSVNTAVTEEIRTILKPEFIESTDKNILFAEVSKIFETLKLNDLVCSVYKRSRHLLHGYTLDSIESMVRNCYSDRGKNAIVDIMVNTN